MKLSSLSILTIVWFSHTNAFQINSSPGTPLGGVVKKHRDTGNGVFSSFSTELREFEEKKREHVGKITKAEHKSTWGARYQVVDSEGNKFDIADKAISFAMHPPNSPGASAKLFSEFVSAHDSSEDSLQSKLDISTEILEMAWEESADEDGDHLLTPSTFVDLVHSHTASSIEKYMAWKVLRTDLAHVFFKEIKEHGRVVGFKAKARKAVEAAKQAFCNDHEDSDLCLI